MFKKGFLKNKFLLSLIFLFTLSVSLIPSISFSAGACPFPAQYTLLAPLGKLTGDCISLGSSGGQSGLASYLDKLFTIGVAISTGLAVIMIVFGGLQYVTADSIGGKGGGKEKIQDALLGLLLAFSAYILLKQISPDLVKNDIQTDFGDATVKEFTNDGLNLSGSQTGGGQSGQISGLNKEISDLSAQLSNPNLTAAERVALQQKIQDKANQLDKVINGGGGNSYRGSEEARVNPYSGPAWTKDEIGKGNPDAYTMEGKTIPGVQTYFSPGEKTTDSGTASHQSASGRPLVEGGPGVIGSVGSIYYPLGTMLKIGENTYRVDDYNFVKNSNGTYSPANDAIIYPNRVDVFTENNNKANGGTPLGNLPITVLSIPKKR